MSFKAKIKQKKKWTEAPKVQQPDDYQTAIFNDGSGARHTIDSLFSYWTAKVEWEDRLRARLKSFLYSMLRIRYVVTYSGTTPIYYADILVSIGLGVAIGYVSGRGEVVPNPPVSWRATRWNELQTIEVDWTAGNFFPGPASTIPFDDIITRYPGIKTYCIMGENLDDWSTRQVRNNYAEVITGGYPGVPLNPIIWTIPGIYKILEDLILDTENKPWKAAFIPTIKEQYESQEWEIATGLTLSNVGNVLVNIPAKCKIEDGITFWMWTTMEYTKGKWLVMYATFFGGGKRFFLWNTFGNLKFRTSELGETPDWNDRKTIMDEVLKRHAIFAWTDYQQGTRGRITQQQEGHPADQKNDRYIRLWSDLSPDAQAEYSGIKANNSIQNVESGFNAQMLNKLAGSAISTAGGFI